MLILEITNRGIENVIVKHGTEDDELRDLKVIPIA